MYEVKWKNDEKVLKYVIPVFFDHFENLMSSL